MTTEPCASAPHDPPPWAALSLPPLTQEPNLSKALGAAWDECEQCKQRHRELAADHPQLPFQMLMLSLIWSAIYLHTQRTNPAASADRLLGQVIQGAHDFISSATYKLLQGIPVVPAQGPDGFPVGRWDADPIADKIDDLLTDDRIAIWDDTVTLLHGILQGEGRARTRAAVKSERPETGPLS